MEPSTKNFRIPKSFVLFGHRYQVEMCNTLYDQEDCFGTAEEDAKLIRLQPKSIVNRVREIKSSTGEVKKEMVPFQITDAMVYETFYHELMHIFLDALGEEATSANEKLVAMIGKAFLELHLSAEYGEEITTDTGLSPS